MKIRRLLRLLIQQFLICYKLIIIPLIAFLPAPIAYGLACLRGDWHYKHNSLQREVIIRNLSLVLAEQQTPAERSRVARDYFRLRSCETVDIVRLAGKGHALAHLVEIRGREHLEKALAAGKGAILCQAHFGSYFANSALIGISGFPITTVGRLPSNFDQSLPPWIRLFWQRIKEQRAAKHWHRPIIQPEPGQWQTAFQMASILRANEVISMAIDPPLLAADLPRAMPMSFLGHQVQLLPGSVTLAQLTGTPLHMYFLYRTTDWRHQVLEISPPISIEGDVKTIFGRCLASVEEAILQQPAHWNYWSRSDDLVALGLLPASHETATTTSLSGIKVAQEK
jgi:lauroyl/myristoyl acyltransferase